MKKGGFIRSPCHVPPDSNYWTRWVAVTKLGTKHIRTIRDHPNVVVRTAWLWAPLGLWEQH